MPIVSPYSLSSEYNLAEMLEHFDSNYVIDIINNKIDNINYASVLTEPNMVTALEEEFKIMYERFPGDESNTRQIRVELYEDIIKLLCDRFNLQFNEDDDNIDRFTAAYYLYDFLICNRAAYMINFFVSFIVNNKNTICDTLGLEPPKKVKDPSPGQGRNLYSDPKFIVIVANMKSVLHHIVGIDITLRNILESIYTVPSVVDFFDNMVSDKGDFCKDFYAAVIMRPEIEPIIDVGVRLGLQKIVGDTAAGSIHELMTMTYGEQLEIPE